MKRLSVHTFVVFLIYYKKREILYKNQNKRDVTFSETIPYLRNTNNLKTQYIKRLH